MLILNCRGLHVLSNVWAHVECRRMNRQQQVAVDVIRGGQHDARAQLWRKSRGIRAVTGARC